MIQREKGFPFPLSLHLGGRAFGPPLCGGFPPATPPPRTSRRSESEGNTTLAARGGRVPPTRVLAGSGYAPAQAGQAMHRPLGPGIHRYDRLGPAIEVMTVHSINLDPERPHTVSKPNMAWQLQVENLGGRAHNSDE